MNKADQIIMAAKRNVVFQGDEFEGFQPDGDYEKRILQDHVYARRGPLEEDPSHKQPIRYGLVCNPSSGKVFAYRRAQDGGYDETRLQGRWSWGVGGHVEREDGEESQNPIHTSLVREVGQEIEIDGRITGFRNLGYVNDESTPVNSVHFGLLYLVEVDTDLVRPNSKSTEMVKGGMIGLEELERIVEDPNYIVEDWSKIAMAPLRNLF